MKTDSIFNFTIDSRQSLSIKVFTTIEPYFNLLILLGIYFLFSKRINSQELARRQRMNFTCVPIESLRKKEIKLSRIEMKNPKKNDLIFKTIKKVSFTIYSICIKFSY
jgi:hypothetical protein